MREGLDRVNGRGLLYSDITAAIGAVVFCIAGGYPEAALTVMLYVPVRVLYGRRYSGFGIYAAGVADLRMSEAELIGDDGECRIIDSDNVKRGDLLRVRPGVRFPVDGTVEQGEAYISRQYLAGDMCPYAVSPGTEVKAGMVAGEDEVIVRAAAESVSSAAFRAYELFERLCGELEKRAQRLWKALNAVSVFTAVAALIVAAAGCAASGGPDWVLIRKCAVLIAVSGTWFLYTSLRAAELAGVLAVIKRGIKPGSTEVLKKILRINANDPESVHDDAENDDILILNDSPKKLEESAAMLKTADSVRIEIIALTVLEKAVLICLVCSGITGLFIAAAADMAVSLLCLMNATRIV